MVRCARYGRDQAVSGASLRHRPGRSAGGSRRAAVRRDRPRGARAVPRAEPVQRRPSDAARLGGGGRPELPRVARERSPRDRGAGVLGAVPGLRRPGRGRAHADRPRRVARDRAVRERHRPAARADASRPEGGPAPPPARDAEPSSSRSSCSTRDRRPFEVPDRSAGPRGRRHTALAARRRRHRRRVRRPAAPDRGRPPSLRDGACVPRGGRNSGQRVHDGRARQPRGSRPHDLSDAPRLPRAAAGAARRRASATIPSPRSRSSTGSERGRAAVVVYDGSTELAVDGAASSTSSSSTGSATRA